MKILRARASDHSAKFCEHEQATTGLNFASKSSKGQILRAWLTCDMRFVFAMHDGIFFPQHMDSDNNMPGVNGEVKKESLETNDEKRDLDSKPKKLDDKSSKTRRTSEMGGLDAERQCLVQRPTDQQWRT